MLENKKKKIMEMVYHGKLSAEEGANLYKQLCNEVGAIKQQVVPTLSNNLKEEQIVCSTDMDIAIIGMSGQFPGAKNVEQYWNNLVQGVHSVTDISTRWDISHMYDSNPRVPNKTYCKWGGLLSDIDAFDPMFFELSPRQAELMEPRQRLFLMESWKALEDAGYSGKSVEGKKCGVFVGCEGSSEYFDHLKQEAVNAHVFLGRSNAILAARIAYFMDLQGPSVTIDTACSSALVAVHLACDSIRSGNCEMAIAGGVQILTEAGAYVLLCSMGMLSPQGKCKAFDNSADGFVPAEAVGTVVLKSKQKAIEDGDHIYGVIKGSGINQDGKTNGITAPSTKSQERLEQEVYRSSHINPNEISYIETHGTGTKLGDPIEFEALSNTFRKYTSEKQFCAIGSVKTNIGHASAASGIASLIKVLLAMKYNKIPPSLHYEKTNQQIKIENSPFYVATKLQDWQPEEKASRMAAVSSFGHSGTNCHMVLEDYQQVLGIDQEQETYYIIPFSAKSDETLKQKITDLYNWCNINGDNYSVKNIGFTLMVGRNHFPYRSCLIVKNMQELKVKIQQLHQDKMAEGYYENTQPKKHTKNRKRMLVEGNTLIKAIVEGHCTKQEEVYSKLVTLANYYIEGHDLDYQKLYSRKACRRISMPGYPFVMDKYWIREEELEQENLYTISRLAPLIDTNESTLEKQCFKKTFTGEEFYLQDHMNMLPAVVYAEMVRTAGSLASPNRQVVKLRNMVWASPITVPIGNPKAVHINLYPKNNDIVDYEVVSEDNGEIKTNSQGSLVYGEYEITDESINISKIMERCQGGKEATDEFYSRIEAMNVVLGHRFRGMKEIYYNHEEAISVVDIPSELDNSLKDYVIHPTITDGAFQTAITWAYSTIASSNTIFLPFVLGELEIVNKSLRVRYAYVTKDSVQNKNDTESIQYNINLIDDEGRIAYRLNHFSVRSFQPEVFAASIGGKQADSVLYYENIWEERPIESLSNQAQLIDKLIIFDKNDNLYHQLSKMDRWRDTKLIRVNTGSEYKKHHEYQYTINANLHGDYVKLIDDIDQNIEGSLHMIHAWCMEDADNEQEMLNHSIYSLFYLTQAMNEKGKSVYLLYLYDSNPYYGAIGGFAKTVAIEYPSCTYKTIQIKKDSQHSHLSDVEIAVTLTRELDNRHSEDKILCYEGKRRLVNNLKEIDEYMEPAPLPLKKEGVYIITGGAGKIGLMIAKNLMCTYRANVVLVGSSARNAEKLSRIHKLQEGIGEVVYIQANIAVREDVNRLIDEVNKKYGVINGIIHAAGVVRDSLIVNKTREQMEQVFAPKIYGLVNMANALQNQGIDFMVLFSSTSSIMGNMGQSDYAYANDFMDHYAKKLHDTRKYGKVISINWPLWETGGMRVDEPTKQMLYHTYGMSPLSEDNGLTAFHTCLMLNRNQAVVIGGNAKKIRRLISAGAKTEEESILSSFNGNDEELFNYFQKDMLQLICSVLRLDKNQVHMENGLEEYGFDSITFTELANKINDSYDLDITPALFFSHSTPMAIVQRLFVDYKGSIAKYYQRQVDDVDNEVSTEINQSRPRFNSDRVITNTKVSEGFEPIAIIGMSGIMPQSEGLEEFWQHIENNHDLMEEIPKDRWNWQEIYGDPQTEDGKTNIKWGAFMKEIDRFDPMFFKISGVDAEIMDPQERLILQTTWHAIEDAGYKPSHFSGTNMGVFVGVSTADYKELLLQHQVPTILSQVFIANRISYTLNLRGPSEPVDTACSSSLVAIHKAIEAIHNGSCDTAIAGGVNVITCPNLYITQSKTNMLSIEGRCKTFDESANGYARGEGIGAIILKPLKDAEADGDHIYAVIKGSAINHGGHGSNLLAPNAVAQSEVIIHAYEQANIDPTTISYIETHGTGTKLGDPIEIDGLKMAFKELYEKWNKPMPVNSHIGLGALKTNIGHLEAAAGIAGILKVILAMKHRKLIGLLHFSNLNPYISLDNSPFEILTDNKEWKNMRDGQGKLLPRRAGISSFGVGGVNAHLVIEEYSHEASMKRNYNNRPKLVVVSAKDKERLKQYVLMLYTSIKEMGHIEEVATRDNHSLEIEEALQEDLINIVSGLLDVDKSHIDPMEDMKELGFDPLVYTECLTKIQDKFNVVIEQVHMHQHVTIESLTSFLATQYKNEVIEHYNRFSTKAISYVSDSVDIDDLAFTLQCGREEMEERLAIIATSIEELLYKLEIYHLDKQYVDDMYTGNIYKDKDKFQIFMSGKASREFVHNTVSNYELDKIAQMWVTGIKIDWNVLYEGYTPRRISIPTYPFAKERYWIPHKKNVKKPTKVVHEKIKKNNDEALMELLIKLEKGKIKTQDIK